jgi:hypothetical protein
MPRFQDIPTTYNPSSTGVTFSWDYMEDTLSDAERHGLQIEPDFQRSHVWTLDQQIAYVEHVLRNGYAGRTIFFNRGPWCYRLKESPNVLRLGMPKNDSDCAWQGYYQYVLVDGLQRLTAARRFMRGEIPAFDCTIDQWESKRLPSHVCFLAVYGELKTRADVLQWYLDLNAGGVIHTSEEIDRVRGLLEQERQKGR